MEAQPPRGFSQGQARCHAGLLTVCFWPPLGPPPPPPLFLLPSPHSSLSPPLPPLPYILLLLLQLHLGQAPLPSLSVDLTPGKGRTGCLQASRTCGKLLTLGGQLGLRPFHLRARQHDSR